MSIKSFSTFRAKSIPLFLIFCLSLSGCGKSNHTADTKVEISNETLKDAIHSPLTVEQAISFFQIEDGLRIDAVAAEPLVIDPVAFAFDETGRLYVVEHRGYPDSIDPDAEPTFHGRIALLEDTTGDGIFDRRTEFAEGLTNPNGIMVWKGGIFVTCAPDLLYLKDNTGDGVADEKKVVLTGFADTRTAQIRFSHPTLALDGWIYLTSGLNGGKVFSPDHPERAPVTFTGRDSRFHPETLVFETVGGRGQYGQTFDDYGRRFNVSNRHPILHVVIEPRDLARNPHLPPSGHVKEVSKVGEAAIVYPISKDMTTASYMPSLMSRPHAGTFTAASGVFMHRGDGLLEEHYGNFFVCESAQNLVQRQILFREGPTFRSDPVHDAGEFLASPDTWFRPVFLGNGPDGALYVADMYRKEIDHPAYMPEEVRNRLDFKAGNDRGRIYRLAAKDIPPGESHSPVRAFGQATGNELIDALSHPSVWQRDTAFRLLLEKQDPALLPSLRQVAANSAHPLQRLYALRLIENYGALSVADVIQAIDDSEAGVREHAVRLGSLYFREDTSLLQKILTLADDADLRVRFNTALALGDYANPTTLEALAKLAARDGADSWMRLALLSSIGDRAEEFLAAFLLRKDASTEARSAILGDLSNIFGASQSADACLRLLTEILTDGNAIFQNQASAVSGLATGLNRQGIAMDGESPLLTLTHNAPDGRAQLLALFAQADAIVRNPDAEMDQRREAVQLLVHAPTATAQASLFGLIRPNAPIGLQIAAIRSLFELPGSDSSPLFKHDRWSTLTPSVREAALQSSFSRPQHILTLLAAIEAGDVPAQSLSPQIRNRLRTHPDKDIKSVATALLQELESGNRMQVYEDLKPVLELTGDPSSGGRVFQQSCAACHTHRGMGRSLGPDLSGISNQPSEAILLHIIVPNYEITSGYESYQVETREGNSIFGLITAETETDITLKNLVEESMQISRSDIAKLSVSTTSLMPDGLETTITRQELADLISYLRSQPQPAE